jgi:hypothetical protein
VHRFFPVFFLSVLSCLVSGVLLAKLESMSATGVVENFDNEKVEIRVEGGTIIVPRAAVLNEVPLRPGCYVTAEITNPEDLKIVKKTVKKK